MRMSPISAALMLPLASAAGEPPAGGTLASTTAEDIVVTAARQERSASTTPASISHMDSAALADISAKHQADSMNRNAGVYVQRGSGAESLMGIRSPVLTGAGACGSFLVAEDSLPIRPVGFCNLNEMFELNYEQAGALEILRGPGSAMFGASAVHGVVNTRTPDVDSLPPWGAGFETGSNSFKRLRLSGASDFGGPVAFGAYGVATRAPGWRDDSGVDEAKLNLLADTTLSNGGELRFRAAGSVLNQETAGFIQGYESYKDPDIARSNPNPEAFRDASSARVAVHYAQESVFGEADDLQLAGIYRRSSMDFIQHFLIGKPFEHNEQTSFMLSAIETIPLGKLTLRVMLDGEIADSALKENQPGPATDGAPPANAIRPAGLHYDYQVDSWTAGATVSVDYSFTEDLSLTAALRADRTNYDYDNRMINGNTRADGTTCGAAGCLYSRPADRSDQFDNLSPSLTFSWQVNAANMVYLNASTGFRPPEMSELYRLQRQQTVAELDSEQLDSLELGWKFRNDTTSLSLATFVMRKDNLILRETNGFNIGNGSTRHRGVEYDLRHQFGGRVPLLVSMAGTYARHQYDFNRAIEGGETIVDGNDVDTAPHNIHTLGVDAQLGDFDLHLDGTYLDRYFLDAANTASYPGHKVANFRASWFPGTLDRRLRLDLRVDNLFDTAYADRADYAFGNYRYFPAQGRAWFISFDFNGR
jgi:iron complex outermembrane receptor protein